MRERQTYLRQLGAQLSVVFPEYAAALGDLLTARARGILRAYPTAPQLAGATPRAIHQAAHRAGARGFTVEDAARLQALARQSTYSGKAVRSRSTVVRTLGLQIERLLTALEALDATMVAELPPPAAEGGPSDADLLQSVPGVGPHTAATLLGELGRLHRFSSGRALVAYVGFYPIIAESGARAAVTRLAALGSRIARRTLYMTAVN